MFPLGNISLFLSYSLLLNIDTEDLKIGGYDLEFLLKKVKA